MNIKKKFSGVISALPTPFENKKIDTNSLKKLVEYQLKNGINGFVVNGTTAESPTLEWDEVKQIFNIVKEISSGEVPIIVGTGTNSTDKTILNNQKAAELGAEAALVVVPYYNKPPQRGLVEHFSKIAETTNIPIILYNVPSRTITGMTTETILELHTKKNIIGIKEASGDINFDRAFKSKMREGFVYLSGDDPTYIDFLKIGGDGIISVMSNAITKQCVQWQNLMTNNKYDEAAESFEKYKKLISLMYIEANPIPLKWILFKMGLFKSPEMRLPLVALDSSHYDTIENEMKKVGIV